MNAEEVENDRLSVLQLEEEWSVRISHILDPEGAVNSCHIGIGFKERDVENTAGFRDDNIGAVTVRCLIVRIRRTRSGQGEDSRGELEDDSAADRLWRDDIDECLVGIVTQTHEHIPTHTPSFTYVRRYVLIYLCDDWKNDWKKKFY